MWMIHTFTQNTSKLRTDLFVPINYLSNRDIRAGLKRIMATVMNLFIKIVLGIVQLLESNNQSVCITDFNRTEPIEN